MKNVCHETRNTAGQAAKNAANGKHFLFECGQILHEKIPEEKIVIYLLSACLTYLCGLIY